MTVKTKTDSISLKVMEAYTRDVGRGHVRIDYDTMDKLKVVTGDVIEIKGKKIIVAKCLPLYPSDENKGLVRIDGMGRDNSGIAIGESTSIRKIKAVAAQKVVVKPLEAIPPIDERYLAQALEGVALIKGNNVMVPYFGGRLTFKVTEIIPQAEAVLVTQKSIFNIEDGTTTKPKISIVEFLESVVSFYEEEKTSFNTTSITSTKFNYLAAKLVVKTNGILNTSTACKIIETILDAKQDGVLE